MSHYSVLVIGKGVEDQLAPYHEFECTGENDQYVVEVNKTDEARKEYESDTETRFRDSEGNLHDRFIYGEWDQRFVRELTEEERIKGGFFGSGYSDGISFSSRDWGDGKGYRPKVVGVLPEGWTRVELPTPTVQTFAEFVTGYYGLKTIKAGERPNIHGEHKFGYIVVDNKGDVTHVIDRTNPDRKWDWYEIGGRWNGFFKLKPGLSGTLGNPGLQKWDSDYEPPEPGRADMATKSNIDIEGMRDESGTKAGEQYDTFTEATVGCPQHVAWKKILERHGQGDGTKSDGKKIEDARQEYHAQPALKALRDAKTGHWFEADDFLCTREEYVQRARDRAISTFAVVKDSKWFERGEMGWWGVVHDEKDDQTWLAEFNKLLESLSDDTCLTVVDCHI